MLAANSAPSRFSMSWNTEVWKMGVVTARVGLKCFPAWMAVVVGPQGLGIKELLAKPHGAARGEPGERGEERESKRSGYHALGRLRL